MNEVWNLDPIYKGFDDPAFEQDLNTLKEKVAEYTAFTQSLTQAEPVAALKQAIALEEELTNLVSKLAQYASLRQSADTRDSAAGSNMGRIMAIYSGIAGPNAAFKAWASALPNLMELVDGDEALQEYHFLFSNMAKSSKYLLPGMGETIMAKMRLSGGSAWGDMRSYLTSTVPVAYRGETTNLSAIRNMAYDADAQVRKDAYEAELACYDRSRSFPGPSSCSAAYRSDSQRMQPEERSLP